MNLIVYIGRFSPLHNGHLKQIRNGLKDFSIEVNGIRLLMLLGTNTEGRTLKNPFTYDERKQMILDSLTNEELHKVVIEPIYDHPSEHVWQYNVIQLINKYKVDYIKDRVYLIGNAEEKSSYYLDNFPEFMYTGIGHDGVHATEIRNLYFNGELGKIRNMVPVGTYNFLKTFTCGVLY